MRRTRPAVIEIEIVKVPYNQFKHNRGEFYVGPGRHEIEIHTEDTPQEVWLSMSSEDIIPVCLGDVDLCGCTIIEKGFIVHALIHSPGVTIEWLADLE